MVIVTTINGGLSTYSKTAAACFILAETSFCLGVHCSDGLHTQLAREQITFLGSQAEHQRELH